MVSTRFCLDASSRAAAGWISELKPATAPQPAATLPKNCRRASKCSGELQAYVHFIV
jgi:hypothetical protein